MEGSQARKLHIVYFLSRKGRTEHPHLLRVLHHSRNGVRLRDVKRWLGELRGNDMPESFSWSYKRRYKTGYVWQDLLDDDLINPISDNEYVLKGSDFPSNNINVSKQKGQFIQEDSRATTSRDLIQTSSSELPVYISTKSSSEIEEESPNFGSETSTLTDDSTRKGEKKAKENQSSTFCSTLLSKKMSDKSTTTDEKKTHTDKPPASDHSKSASNGHTHVFRNLISCGASDTNDSAVMPMHHKQSNVNNRPGFLSKSSSELKSVVQQSAEICKRENDRFGGSQRVFGTPSWTQQQYWSCGRKSFDGVKDSLKNKSELRAASAAYMPVGVPNCSQCGKPFKPEKLHAHMTLCKGMKTMSKTVADHVDKPLKIGHNLLAH